ncbi:hypothetical protein ABW21_db0206167 [Orbilia brochopaga]|nr:hypothetical protein ABW21_db0206167 [Drechslerella brochopaga]
MRSQEILEYRPWALNSLGQPPVTEPQISHQSSLEARIIALETKLRHSSPDHPCDCKYELSLLEEKLGTLRQHPWERRLSELESKQKRDTSDLNKLYKEFQEHETKVDQLILDHHWDYDNEGQVHNVVKSTSIVYVVERMLAEMTRFDKSQSESEESIKMLKSRFESIKMDSQDHNRQLNYAQSAVTDQLRELGDEAEQLKTDVTELWRLKEKLADDLRHITGKLDQKVEELERTISSISRSRGASSDPETKAETLQTTLQRTVWVPPTSEKPTETPYPYNIPTFMKQPDGWSDIRAQVCKNLEESQRVYYSKLDKIKVDDDADIAHSDAGRMSPIGRLASSELSELDDDLPRRRKRKKDKRKKVEPSLVTLMEDAGSITEKDSASILDDLQLLDVEAEETKYADMIASPAPVQTTVDIIDSPVLCEEPNVPEVTGQWSIFDRPSGVIVPKKSKSSLRKKRSRKSLKDKSKARYARVDEVFAQAKQPSDRLLDKAKFTS